jgi:glycosyltransferase involved in cell wall biosynthesis
MKTVVHISADYPDPFAPNKTAAIANLIDGAPGFRHVVYSLNRVNGLFGVTASQFGEDRICVVYRAPPKGMLLRTCLDRVAGWIGADLAAGRIRPDLVHSHKFTVEGLIGLRLKAAFGCPIVCNIQGDTDVRVAGVRRDLSPVYRTLAQESTFILPFAPWCGPAMERILGARLRYEVLPVSTTCDALLTPVERAAPRLVSLFHLDSWRRKGADTLATAVTLVARDEPRVTLDIYGRGSARQAHALRACISRRAGLARIRLMGPLTRDRVQKTLNGYSAFVMPSRRETYGLAFVEALFSGIPVVFPCDRAIDGILPESDIGAACDPSQAGDVARAIKYVLDNQAALKARLAAAQAAGALDHLRLDRITARYRQILETASQASTTRPSPSRAPASVLPTCTAAA